MSVEIEEAAKLFNSKIKGVSDVSKKRKIIIYIYIYTNLYISLLDCTFANCENVFSVLCIHPRRPERTRLDKS